MPLWILAALAAGVQATEPGGCQRPATITVDVSLVDPGTYARLQLTELYKSLLLRLMEERLAVVAAGQPSDMTLNFRALGPESLRLEARFRTLSRGIDVPLAASSLAIADVHLDILHRCIEIIREVQDESSRCTPAIPPALQAPESAAAPAPPREAEEQGGPPEVSSNPTALARAGPALVWNPGGPALGLQLAGAWRPGSATSLNLWLATLVTRPLQPADRLELLEGGAHAGLCYQPSPSARPWSWRTCGGLGAWLHAFAFTPRGGKHEQVTRVAAAGRLEAALAMALLPAWTVELAAGVMATNGQWVHRVDAVQVYRATLVRGTVGMSLSYLWD